MNIEYIQRIKKIEVELDRWLPRSDSQNTDFAIADEVFPHVGNKAQASFDTLFAPLSDMLSRGGKRWRPLMMTLLCETLGGNDAALPLTPLVEFCHNASLIHDDIEDNSDERRGKPAVHHIYGVDTAINSGSFFYFLSLNCINTYTGANKEMLYKLWGDYLRKLHLGQAMDIRWHRDVAFIPGVEDYYMMCGMKTGGLAGLAAELGAFAAGTSTDTMRLVGEAGEKLGIVYQIMDDIKNLTTGVPGKKRGDDIVEGKKSLPVLLYLTKYPEKKEKVFNCFCEAKENGVNAPEVEELIDIFTSSGVLNNAERIAQLTIKEVREVFSSPQYAGAPASEEGRKLLDGLFELIC